MLGYPLRRPSKLPTKILPFIIYRVFSCEIDNGRTDVFVGGPEDFSAEECKSKVVHKHGLLLDTSDVFTVGFIRPEWGVCNGQWTIASFRQPPMHAAIVLCLIN